MRSSIETGWLRNEVEQGSRLPVPTPTSLSARLVFLYSVFQETIAMTEKIFWEHPYLTELETYVTSVKGNDITVEKTIFFALSGGQESDHGTIGNTRVLHARKEGKEIIYTLENAHGIKPGDQVSMSIDWKRRYKLMRLHFAAEIVLELIYSKLGSVRKIGAHIASNKARIDFEWDEKISRLFPELNQEARAIIAANHKIVSAFSDEQNQQRYWQVADFAKVPCGGTHLEQTGEVGEIELRRKNIGKGKERIEIYLSGNVD